MRKRMRYITGGRAFSKKYLSGKGKDPDSGCTTLSRSKGTGQRSQGADGSNSYGGSV